MPIARLGVRVLVLLLALLAGACEHTLVPTPYVMYGEAGERVFAQVPEALRTPEIPVIYVTDRAPLDRDHRGQRYGHHRNRAMAYGVARVSLGEGVDWETLAADSTRAERSRSYPMRVSSVEPVGQFGDLLQFQEVVAGRLHVNAEGIARYRAEASGMVALLDEWLARSERKEVAIFVHGFNNTFDDAVMRMAQAWHLSGRIGVPIVYTWPAGSGGLKGYAYDRESGEFSVVHLKLLLAMLANHPGVERVHLLSHSRGTDVAATALRELHAEIRGAMHTSPIGAALGAPPPEPRATWQVLKLETLVLAAPDMDVDVFVQRFFGENLLQAANHIVIYASGRDKALGFADWLFRSRRRVGALRLEDYSPEGLALLHETTSLQVIECEVTGHSSHAYLVEHPAAFSDLILVLRDGLPPGDPRRPLVQKRGAIWTMDNDYMRPGAGESPYTGWPD